jgi:hypothetical protein
MLHFNTREFFSVESIKRLEEGNDALLITKKARILT